jgi:RimJ/RimL family protein N-acetyltransferase
MNDTTLNIPHPYKDGAAEEWIATHQAIFDDGKGVHFAITLRSDGALVGAISLRGLVAGHQAELGYWIGLPYWNRGYCAEAARAVLAYAFSDLGLIRVHSCYLKPNQASGRVMQKIGMTHEGCRRQHVLKWDKTEDLELYGTLRDEWNGANPAVEATS